eukprot:COSAG05_NODE_303_length_11737_cov_116.354270_2_plen_273_part_00
MDHCTATTHRRLGCVAAGLGEQFGLHRLRRRRSNSSGSKPALSGPAPCSSAQPPERMKICIGRLWQESNDFSPVFSTRDMFENDNPFFRADEITQPGQHGAELGGIVDALMEWPENPQLIGLASAQCFPNGRVTTGCHAWLRDEILGPLKTAVAGGVDAVIVSLHGAMVAQDEDDPEGALLRSIRALIGPRVPLVISLDLHCHLTPAILGHVDALCLYHTNPHQDLYETGQRAVGMLRRILVPTSDEQASVAHTGVNTTERKGNLPTFLLRA